MSSPPCSGETMKAERMTRDWFGEAQFAVIFFVLLLGINIFLNPARFRLDALGTVFGLAAPLILAAITSTPVILAGRGGMDIAVGRLMGLLKLPVVLSMIGDWDVSWPDLVVLFLRVIRQL